MSDVVEQINARLDAMQAAAEAATPGPWRSAEATHGDPANGPAHIRVWSTASEEDDWRGGSTISEHDYSHEGDADAAHIALNNPAAVLAMVAGLRAVVALHEPYISRREGITYTTPDHCGAYPCSTLRAIAAIFPAPPARDVADGSGS